MLIRFVIKNTFSFDEAKEFNMLPNTRLKTLKHHIYTDSNILKLSSIYGANGAGKSNLIKAIYLFQKFVLESKMPYELQNSIYKFHAKNLETQLFIIEFVEDNIPFLYGIEFSKDIILTEELYISGLGKKEDVLIFERKTNTKRQSNITFSPEFEKDEKSLLLKSILIEDFVKPNELIIKLLSNRDNKYLKAVKTAFQWFKKTLQIILPGSIPRMLVHNIEVNDEYRKFVENFVKSFELGIEALETLKKDIYEFLGENDKAKLREIISKIEKHPNKIIRVRLKSSGNEITIVKENNKIWVKKVVLLHKGKNNQIKKFELEEESDGTIRLLDFAPAFKGIISDQKVFIIDEIERSIHPLLIKKLVEKFSQDNKTNGQLIFTTHESNLLDQSIFRQDEIWFVEKDKWGATDIYSLSDFKEHKTIDIKKGYLSGRYGAIPFLANIEDLNWE